LSRPPGAWQPAPGSIDGPALFAPLPAFGLPRFGPDIDISGRDAAHEATSTTGPTLPLYLVVGANAPGDGSGHYQPRPLSSFSGVWPLAAGAIRGPTAESIHNPFTPPAACTLSRR
jgi:hypothetical protein